MDHKKKHLGRKITTDGDNHKYGGGKSLGVRDVRFIDNNYDGDGVRL